MKRSDKLSARQEQNPAENSKNTQLQWYFVIAVFLFAVVFMAAIAWLERLEQAGQLTFDEFLVQEIYTLDPRTTAEELTRQGFVDLTDIQPGSNQQVRDFLANATTYHYATLKTFVQTEDELTVTALWANNNDKYCAARGGAVFRTTTYLVKYQGAINPGQPYMGWYEADGEDGMTEVWLKASTAYLPERPNGNGEDVLLYRYQTT